MRPRSCLKQHGKSIQRKLSLTHWLLADFLKTGLDKIAPQDFLSGVSVQELEKPAAAPEPAADDSDE